MGGSTTLDFKTSPGLLLRYPKVFLARRPRLVPNHQHLGRIEGRVTVCRAEEHRLDGYRRVCRYADAGCLPVTYPHVLATSLHLAMLTSKAFPIRLPGLIHTRHRITQWRSIPAVAPVSLCAWLDGHQDTRVGQEFELNTQVILDQECVWQESATFLARASARKPAAERPATSSTSGRDVPGQYVVLEADANTGRRYARVSGDFNPIHLSAWSARLFGFTAPIAHGMWCLARCCSELITENQDIKKTIYCDFKQPVPLPARLRLEQATIPAGLSFILCSEDGSRSHLAGVISHE